MTRKEMAIKLATIQKERLHLNSSVEELAKRYLKGCGAVKAFTKDDFIKALEIVENQ